MHGIQEKIQTKEYIKCQVNSNNLNAEIKKKSGSRIPDDYREADSGVG